MPVNRYFILLLIMSLYHIDCQFWPFLLKTAWKINHEPIPSNEISICTSKTFLLTMLHIFLLISNSKLSKGESNNWQGLILH